MKTSLFALAVLVAMTGAALPQSRTFYDSTTGRITGRSTTDSGGATTYYGADGRVIGRSATTGNSTTTIYNAGGHNVGRVVTSPTRPSGGEDHGSVK